MSNQTFSDTMENRFGYILEAIARYSDRRWRVLPLWSPRGGACTCGRAECNSAGKHPRIKDWKTAASSDFKTIRAWLGAWKDMNLGIVTGAETGIFVLDIDGAEGEQNLAQLLNRYGGALDTLTARTGKGRHLYFRHPGREVKTTAGVLAKALDVRGEGAYIIAPPSLHVNGSVYEFVDKMAPIAAAPDWLVALVCGDTQVEQTPLTPEREASIQEGSRNQTLFEHACGMRGRGASHKEIEDELVAINQQFCNPPLEAAEVKQIAASAAKYRPTTARSAPAITGDNNALRWFPFDTVAWRRNHYIFAMKAHHVGWYIWLIVECWERGGYLPNDPELLAKLARAASPAKFAKEMDVILAEFEVTDDKLELVHAGLRAEYEQRAQKVEKKRQAGLKRGEQLRAQKEALPQAG